MIPEVRYRTYIHEDITSAKFAKYCYPLPQKRLIFRLLYKHTKSEISKHLLFYTGVTPYESESSENTILKKTTGPKSEEVTGEWKN
jgi:hypothetical protein